MRADTILGAYTFENITFYDSDLMGLIKCEKKIQRIKSCYISNASFNQHFLENSLIINIDYDVEIVLETNGQNNEEVVISSHKTRSIGLDLNKFPYIISNIDNTIFFFHSIVYVSYESQIIDENKVSLIICGKVEGIVTKKGYNNIFMCKKSYEQDKKDDRRSFELENTENIKRLGIPSSEETKSELLKESDDDNRTDNMSKEFNDQRMYVELASIMQKSNSLDELNKNLNNRLENTLSNLLLVKNQLYERNYVIEGLLEILKSKMLI